MRFSKHIKFALILAMGIFIVTFYSGPALAQDIAPETLFADFDGDGINDNTPDDDGDGIPNPADPDFDVNAVKGTEQKQAGMINFGRTIKESGLALDLSTNSEKFGKRQFCGRALSKNRCGFTSEEGFGSEGVGIGVGGGGGACAGGVCR